MSDGPERRACRDLEASFGPGEPPATGSAPGRCTLVGEHVDYADGLVTCIGIQLGVGVAVRRSSGTGWRMASGTERAERGRAEVAVGQRGLADRVLAVVLALATAGIRVPPLDVAVAADLPSGVGLSSSAALSVGVIVAALRLVHRRLPAVEVVRVALAAERDVLGIPVGPLDQRAIVLAPASGALFLDCRAGGGMVGLPWHLGDVGLVAVDTAAAHDVGGEGYRSRRTEAAAALRALGATSWRDVTPAHLVAARLPPPLAARGRHIVTETERAAGAALALRLGDAGHLGELMSASHASLRDDYEVSTAALDAVVAAAGATAGCLGARLVGAGFGGAAIALTEAASTDLVRAAMVAASGGPGPGWVLQPAAGVAVRAPDAVT